MSPLSDVSCTSRRNFLLDTGDCLTDENYKIISFEVRFLQDSFTMTILKYSLHTGERRKWRRFPQAT